MKILCPDFKPTLRVYLEVLSGMRSFPPTIDQRKALLYQGSLSYSTRHEASEGFTWSGEEGLRCPTQADRSATSTLVINRVTECHSQIAFAALNVSCSRNITFRVIILWMRGSL